jgi:hypothetical protein
MTFVELEAGNSHFMSKSDDFASAELNRASRLTIL